MKSDTLLAAKFLSFMLLLAVMLFQPSVERVKALRGKGWMCILWLQMYLQSSI